MVDDFAKMKKRPEVLMRNTQVKYLKLRVKEKKQLCVYAHYFFSTGGLRGLRKAREEVRGCSNTAALAARLKWGGGHGLARTLFVSSTFFRGLSVPLVALFPTSICMLFPTSVCDFTE